MCSLLRTTHVAQIAEMKVAPETTIAVMYTLNLFINGCGGGIRTHDLQVMSLTTCRLSTLL